MAPVNWKPPEDWVPPPDNFLPNVVPPWVPIDSWMRPSDWMPFEDWVPLEEWKPPVPHIYVCPMCGVKFEIAGELDAHFTSVHPEMPIEHSCPFCGGIFDTIVDLEAHVESTHPFDSLTLDQIPDYLDPFMPLEFLEAPPDWLAAQGLETYYLPPLDKIPFFVPPWLDPEKNHWVPPENKPFWTWNLDNIAPGEQINICIAEDMLPQVNLGGGTWVTATEPVEYVLLGGIRIYTENITIPENVLNDVITTVLNLDELPKNVPPPDENFYELLQIGTNIPEYIEKAEVGFKVDKDWINANNLDEDTLTLEHYGDGVWTELPTTIIGRDENYVYCEAQTPSFSVFAVTGEAIVPTPKPAPAPFPWYLVGVGVGVAIVLMAFALYKKRKL